MNLVYFLCSVLVFLRLSNFAYQTGIFHQGGAWLTDTKFLQVTIQIIQTD